MMLKFLKEILFSSSSGAKKEQNEKKLQIAACALFVEIARADNDFTQDERQKIISLMKNRFNLEEQFAKELIELSERKVDESVSIYEFTTVINSNFSKDEKFKLLENLWRLIFIDDTLNKYEDNLVRKIGILLNLEHSDIVTAKVLVRNELKK